MTALATTRASGPTAGSTATERLVVVRQLHADYDTPRGPVPALRGVDLQIQRGEITAVVGESGSGKSTLAHALIGLLPANGRIVSGAISFGDLDLHGLSERRFRALRGTRIGLVPQDPTVSLNPVRTIGDQVAEAVTAHRRLPRASARARAAELLEQAGIDRPPLRLRQYPHELSGGMRQRVLIAIALAGDPDLIIADEPTSALDATVQKRILDHLEELTRAQGISVLLVTHDLGVAAERADRIVVMNQGRVVETGTPAEVLENPTDAYTRRLVAAAPGLTWNEDYREPVSPESPVLLRATDLTRTFRMPGTTGKNTELTAVDRVSFEIRRGETLALVGESGSGKSTTAKLVLGLESPSSGRVEFDGVDVGSLGREQWRQLRRRAQLIYQNPYASLDPRFTLEQLITEPLDAFRVGTRAERRATAARLLERVALPADYAQRSPAELSGGQRQRVAIARALALNPDLVVCDEPVSALDVSVQAQVLELLSELQRDEGLTYLFITHDLAVVRQLAHRVAVMRSGQIVELAPTRRIFTAPEHDYTRELLGSIAGTAAGAVTEGVTP